MESIPLKSPLSNAQLEILKLFSREMSEEDLLDLKRTLVKFLAAKAAKMADEIWDEKGWTNEDMHRLLNTHMRTPYNPKNK